MTTTAFRDQVSSTLLLLLNDADPSLAPGTDPNPDPGSVLCVRTDVPSVYYKSGPLVTDWTLVGTGAAAADVVGKMSTLVNQAVPDLSVNLLVDFDTQDFSNTPGLVDLAGNRFIAPVAGNYLVTGTVVWVAAASPNAGNASLVVLVNGVNNPTAVSRFDFLAAGQIPGSSHIATTLRLAAGDVVTFGVSLVSGAAQALDTAEATIQRVSA